MCASINICVPIWIHYVKVEFVLGSPTPVQHCIDHSTSSPCFVYLCQLLPGKTDSFHQLTGEEEKHLYQLQSRTILTWSSFLTLVSESWLIISSILRPALFSSLPLLRLFHTFECGWFSCCCLCSIFYSRSSWCPEFYFNCVHSGSLCCESSLVFDKS